MAVSQSYQVDKLYHVSGACTGRWHRHCRGSKHIRQQESWDFSSGYLHAFSHELHVYTCSLLYETEFVSGLQIVWRGLRL